MCVRHEFDRESMSFVNFEERLVGQLVFFGSVSEAV